MAEIRQDENVNSRNDALASLPAAVQPQRAVDVADPLSDTTSILQGSQAILSKASKSAGRMTVDADPFAAYQKAQEEKDRRDEAEARELAMLAAWSKEKTTIGGVEMTNGEAQEARQRVIDNDEAYASWAVKTGRIREDQKDEFKAAIWRQKELADKRGRGTLTEAEAAEIDRLNRSHVGQAADAATANDHLLHARGLDARAELADGNAKLRDTSTVPSSGDQSPFQAMQAATPAPPKPAPVADRVRATGLDL